MVWPPALDELERTLGEVLEAVRRWRIKANTLELYDETGEPLALLEAVSF
jgi:hypothetical protein